MPKELFNQTSVTTFADDDRIAASQPSIAGAKNMTWTNFLTFLKSVFFPTKIQSTTSANTYVDTEKVGEEGNIFANLDTGKKFKLNSGLEIDENGIFTFNAAGNVGKLEYLGGLEGFKLWGNNNGGINAKVFSVWDYLGTTELFSVRESGDLVIIDNIDLPVGKGIITGVYSKILLTGGGIDFEYRGAGGGGAPIQIRDIGSGSAIQFYMLASGLSLYTGTTASEKLDVGGNINASGVYKVAGVSGFTGTGAYTNFTIVGGIITAAS